MSSPFNLIEGSKAFVMFKSVDLCYENSDSCFIALIVITAEDFNFSITDNSLGMLIYHNSKVKSDDAGQFVLKDFESNHYLPQFTFEIKLKDEDAGYILQVTKQFQFNDIS